MFKTGAKINLYILLIPVIVVSTIFLLYSLALKISCDNITLKQFASPNNELKVVLIKKNCGSLRALEFEGYISKD